MIIGKKLFFENTYLVRNGKKLLFYYFFDIIFWYVKNVKERKKEIKHFAKIRMFKKYILDSHHMTK